MKQINVVDFAAAVKAEIHAKSMALVNKAKAPVMKKIFGK